MIPTEAKLRIARPTDNLDKIAKMNINGLGFEKLADFKNHRGFDGIIIGHPEHIYHLEFTHHRGTLVGRAPTKDNLLIFYLSDEKQWKYCCENMNLAGFNEVDSYNPYWDEKGKTFEDMDGYRVVLQNQKWIV